MTVTSVLYRSTVDRSAIPYCSSDSSRQVGSVKKYMTVTSSVYRSAVDRSVIPLLCPQLRRSWRGILVSGCPSVSACVRSSRTVHARVLKFHIWIPHGKIFDTRFFSCPSYLPFWSYAPLNKIGMKYDACHILWTVHARVLKFHIWIPHGKIADLYFFSCPSYLPFKVMPLWKKSEWSLSARYLEKYLSYMLETWSADRGWCVDYLIKFFKKITIFFRSYGPLKILALWKNQNEIFSARYLKKYLS